MSNTDTKLQIYMPRDMREAVHQAAEALRISDSEWIRRAIAVALERSGRGTPRDWAAARGERKGDAMSATKIDWLEEVEYWESEKKLALEKHDDEWVEVCAGYAEQCRKRYREEGGTP